MHARDGVMSCVEGTGSGVGGTEDRFELDEKMCVVLELGVGRVTCQFFSRFSDFVACDQSEVLKLQCAPIENFGQKFEGLKKE